MIHVATSPQHATSTFFARTRAIVSHVLVSSGRRVGAALAVLNGRPACRRPDGAEFPTTRLWIVYAR